MDHNMQHTTKASVSLSSPSPIELESNCTDRICFLFSSLALHFVSHFPIFKIRKKGATCRRRVAFASVAVVSPFPIFSSFSV
jgi:hypothetical protein